MDASGGISSPVAVLTVDAANAGPARVAAKRLAEHFPGETRVLALNWSPRETTAWLNLFPSVEVVDISFERPRLPPGYGHISPATHLRALIPQYVDNRLAVYFDADTFIRRNVSFEDFFPDPKYAAGGVRDSENPFLGCDASLVPLRCELGLNLTASGINAGVLAMNLDLWRETDLGPRILALTVKYGLRGNSALNAALNGHVRLLSMTLNATAHMMRPTSRVFGWEALEDVEAARTDPAIVHFTGAVKPWHSNAELPFMDEWQATADSVGWTDRSHSFTWRRRFERRIIAAVDSSLKE